MADDRSRWTESHCCSAREAPRSPSKDSSPTPGPTPSAVSPSWSSCRSSRRWIRGWRKDRLWRFVKPERIGQMTFENTGSLFASLEPGPRLDYMYELFTGLLKGVRASPVNLPGTAYRHAFEGEALGSVKRADGEKKQHRAADCETNYDPMDGQMSVEEDEEGNQLSDEEVLGNIVSLVVAGYDSTALASMWPIYYLGKYPDILKKSRINTLRAFC